MTARRHCWIALAIVATVPACKGSQDKPKQGSAAAGSAAPGGGAAPAGSAAPTPGLGSTPAEVTGTLSNAMADAVKLQCAEKARDVKGNQGTTWYMFCPAGCGEGSLWGTDLYTDDSSVCLAAIHAGAIKPDKEGIVLVTWTPGEQVYAASNRNGVSSGGWGRWGRSFFVQAIDATGKPTTPAVKPLPEGTVRVGCDTNAGNLEGGPGKKWHVICPAGCQGNLYGTDVYTSDSSLCTAAIHAGALAADKPGEFDIELGGPQKEFKGTKRNGRESGSWGEYPNAFKFVK